MQKSEETFVEREYDEWENGGESYHLTVHFDGAWEVVWYEARLILPDHEFERKETAAQLSPEAEAAMKEWVRGKLEAEAEAYYEHQESEPRIRNWNK